MTILGPALVLGISALAAIVYVALLKRWRRSVAK